MRHIYRHIILTTLLFTTCSTWLSGPSRTEVMDSANRPQPAQSETPAPETPIHDWSKISPIDFLNMLGSAGSSYAIIQKGNEPPPDWIKAEHIDLLLTYVGSNKQAASVLSVNSPYLPNKPSTLGIEAMYLMEGFRRGAYPPTLCSTYDFKPAPYDYAQWWAERAPRAVSTMSKPNKATGIGYIVSLNNPTRDEVTKDSKPAELSIIDQALYAQDSFVMGATYTAVLIGTLTNKVEYVWANPYKLYVKPMYVLPNAQALYDRAKGNT